MKNLLPLAAILCCFSSCVTMFNKDFVAFRVNVDKRAEVTYHKAYPERGVIYDVHSLPGDSTGDGRKDVFITAKRSKHDSVAITVKQDGVERIVKIKPVHSNVFYYNFYPLYGLGMLVDMTNENRFTYPSRVYLDIADAEGRGYMTHLPWFDHKWEIVVKPPIVNLFITKFNYVHPSVNLAGIVFGVNHYLDRNRFFSAELGACLASTSGRNYRNRDSIKNFLFNSAFETKSDIYVSIMQNHVLRRFSVGYGLNMGHHTATRFYQRYKMDDTVLHDASYMSVGCAFAGRYRLSNALYFTFNYMPQFVAIDKRVQLSYEHAFNFGLTIKDGYGKKWKAK